MGQCTLCFSVLLPAFPHMTVFQLCFAETQQTSACDQTGATPGAVMTHNGPDTS